MLMIFKTYLWNREVRSLINVKVKMLVRINHESELDENSNGTIFPYYRFYFENTGFLNIYTLNFYFHCYFSAINLISLIQKSKLIESTYFPLSFSVFSVFCCCWCSTWVNVINTYNPVERWNWTIHRVRSSVRISNGHVSCYFWHDKTPSLLVSHRRRAYAWIMQAFTDNGDICIWDSKLHVRT